MSIQKQLSRKVTLKRIQSKKDEEVDDKPYVEKPRANLYNVINRLRDYVVSTAFLSNLPAVQIGYKHCLLVIKLNDFESKHD